MKRYTAATLPADARYIGSTEGPHGMSEFIADLVADAIDPACTQDPDGTRHFYELCPLN